MRIFGLIAVTALFSTFAFADDWTGKLIDSNCHDRQSTQGKNTPQGAQQQTPQQNQGQAGQGQAGQAGQGQGQAGQGQAQQGQSQSSAAQASCAATEQSTVFALMTNDGKVYKLDTASNSRVMAALRNRADREAPGAKQDGAAKPAEITAKIEGSLAAGTIKVDDIEIQ